MTRPSSRRCVLFLLAAAAMLALGAPVAHATLPAAVAKNMGAVTELEYKFFDPSHRSGKVYPSCHRTCERLLRELATPAAGQQRFDRFDELFLLALRTKLTQDFNNLSFTLPGSPADKQVVLGNPYWRNGPQRYAGLQVPGIAGTALFSTSHLVYPGDELIGFWVNGVATALEAPSVGWPGNKDTTSWCGNLPEPADIGGPSPGPGWILLRENAAGYDCATWNEATQQWVHTAGTTVLWSWWHPAEFYGPSKLQPWIAPDDPEPWGLSAPDLGFALTQSQSTDELGGTNADDYTELVTWLDLALGGDGTGVKPRDLDGDGNPAEPGIKHAYCGDPVNCATGNFTESFTDTHVQGPGVTLSQGRSYNSQQAAEAIAPGPFGFGWSATFRAHLSFPAGSNDVVVHQENGSQVRYTAGLDGNYAADEFVRAKLSHLANGRYRYTLPNDLAFEFDGDGRLLSETDRAGNRTSLTYVDGRVSAVEDAVGRELIYSYNSDSTVSSVTDPAGHVVHYGYIDGDLTSVTDVGGAVTQFGYDASHQLTTVTDPRGHVVTHNSYDALHRVVEQEDALGHSTTWDYGSGETTITDPSGSVTHEEFEDFLPTKITRAAGTPSQATTQYSYDDAYNLIEKIDANGNHWTYDYDLRGNLIASTDPLGHGTSFTYDEADRVARVEAPGGVLTELGYTDTGLLLSSTTSAGTLWESKTYDYNSRGQVTQASAHHSRDDRWTIYTYDSQGNVSSIRSPGGRTSMATYDADGFTTSTTTPRGKTTTITRDAYGQPTQVLDARGKTTNYVYDGDHNLTSTTDRNGHTTTTVYDAMNRPTEDHRPDGSIWTTSYDVAGQVATRTDGRGKTTSYTYDHQHRLHSKTDPLDRSTTYGYDGVGNLTEATLPDGTQRELSYDAAGRLTDVDTSGGSSDDISFGYDAADRRTSMTDGTGTTSYAYDDLGRLAHQTTAAGQTTAYHYDGFNRVTAIDYPDALSIVATGSAPQHVATGTVTRTYDLDDHLTGVTDWLGHTTTFAYDGDGDLTHVTRPNGVDAASTFDDVGAMLSITDASATTSLARDDERQLSGTDDGTATASFSYDGADRLLTGNGRSYAYDDADDLTRTATAAGAPVDQHFDDANQLTSRTAAGSSVATLAYDDDGQRTGMTPSAGGAASTYAWTRSGRLKTYSGPDLSGSTSGAATTESYSYDGDGLRQTVTTGTQRRHQAWDVSGPLPLMITDGPTSYVTGPGGLPIEQITGSGTVRYFSHDQLGSTTALTDATGTVVQRYAYDAYGQLTSATPTVENPFRYAGQYTDTTTGLQYLRARYYDAATGQFISRDPLEGDTLQPYAYAGNNPTNAIDPTGLSWGWVDDLSGVVSSVIPSQVSDVSATIVDFITGGAASDIACNGLSWGNATEAGVNLGMTFVPGGLEAREGLAAGRLAAKAGEDATRLLGPGTSFGTKIEGQLAKRGWTRRLVQSTIDNPASTVPTRDTRFLPGGGRMDDPATGYVGRRGGYVVRNDRTGDVVQVSDRTDPNWRAPWDR